MRRPLHAVLLACLVLLAGCNGLGATDASPPVDPTADGTPTVGTPTGGATTRTAAFPPGVTGNGVAAPFELSNAHANALADTSYTVRETRELREANGTLRSGEVETNRMAAERGRYRYDLAVDGTAERFYGGSAGTLAYYANGSAVARKTAYPNGNAAYGMEYDPDGELADPAAIFHGTPRNDERIAVLLNRLDATVEPRENGTYLIRAAAFTGEGLTMGGTAVSNVSNVEFSATVESSGLVRGYHLLFEGTVDGQRVSGVERVRYSKVGSTTVEEPDWYGKAAGK